MCADFKLCSIFTAGCTAKYAYKVEMPYNLLVVGLRLVGQQFDNKSKWAIVEFGFALETF